MNPVSTSTLIAVIALIDSDDDRILIPDPQSLIPMTIDHSSFQSPFTWRYASAEMRAIWSEVNKRKLWRRIWVALAEAQSRFGLVTPEQVADLQAHVDQIDMERALQIEAEIKHDLMAEVKTYAEQCPIGGGIIHLGATSMDVEDNADALRVRESLDLILAALQAVAAARWRRRSSTMPMCPRWPLRTCSPPNRRRWVIVWRRCAQDLLIDYAELARVRGEIKGKGFKGAVGTAASYIELLGSSADYDDLETHIMEALDLEAFEVATQTYPRKQDWLVLNALAGLAHDAVQVRVRSAHPAVAAHRRVERAVRREAGRIVGDALQAQSHQRGEDRFAGALSGAAAARGVGRCGAFAAGTHAGRFGQSARDPAGSVFVRG